MQGLIQDVRYGIRTLTKSPGFTLVAVVALALGIGANTAMFSYVNAWVLHPLPYPQGDRIVVLINENTKTGSIGRMVDAADFYDFQRGSRDLEDVSAWRVSTFNLTGDGAPERIDGYRVSWNFFQTLGAKAALGRTFLPEEDQAGAPHVAILSRGLWETRYASDPQILGRKIKIDGESYEIVGVMPSKFQLPFTGESKVWLPLAFSAEQRTNRWKTPVFAMGRLKAGSTLAEAQSEMTGLASQLQKAYPNTNAHSGILLHTLEYEIGSNQGNQEVLICFWIVALVLLMACANVANLMLARATGRTKELAVRTAMGAGRGRLIRQLVTETVLLFFVAGAAGVGVAYWTLAWLAAAIPARSRGFLINHGQVNLDYQTLLYTFGIAFIAGVAFGLAPAISGSKLDVFSMLKEASGRASSDRGGARLRNAFVIAEIALAVVVVVCSAILARSFLRMMHSNPGFRPENVMAAQLDLPQTKYETPVEIRNFYDELTARLRALPEVEQASASEYIPFGECCTAVPVFAVDKPAPRPADVPYAEYSAVTPDYFATIGIGLVKGRYFMDSDGPSAPPVIVINQTLATYFWHGADPVGQKLKFTEGNAEHIATVVGVVADVKLYNSMSGKHDRELYTAFEQFPTAGMGIVARSRADHSTLANAIRSAVWGIDADQPVSLVSSVQKLIDDQYAGFQIVTDLMAFFSSLAVLLGAIGIYAVMAFNVTQRTHEIGIRMALGAHPREILLFVLRSGAWMTASGIAIGTVGAVAAARLISSVLYDVSGTAEGVIAGRPGSDPAAFAGGLLLLLFVAFMACYVPARRAMRVDPLVALRYE